MHPVTHHLRCDRALTTFAALAAAAALLLAPTDASARWAHEGLLDASWAGDGSLHIDLPPAGDPGSPGFVVTADGRVMHIAVHSSHVGSGTGCVRSRYQSHVVLRRFRPGGGRDLSFGRRGISTIRRQDASIILGDGVLQPDGRVVFGGTMTRGDRRQAVVIRITRGGWLDRTFGGGDGIAVVPHGGDCSHAAQIAVQGDGKIVVAAARLDLTDTERMHQTVEVRRLLPDGRPDRSYASRGVALVDPDSGTELVHDVTLGKDGAVVLAGASHLERVSRVMVVRLLASGRRDLSFGRRGIVIRRYPDSEYAYAGTVTVDASGRTLVAGGIWYGHNERPLLSRMDHAGRVDRTFAEWGTVPDTSAFSSQSWFYRILLQPDGRLLAIGSFSANGLKFPTVTRVHRDGRLDRTLPGNGRMQIPLHGGADSHLYADGRLLLGDADDIIRLRVPGAARR